MKPLKFLLCLCFCSFCAPLSAQSPQVKKAAKAIFSLNTFRADGTPIATSFGVFVSQDGTAVSQWKPFVGAAKAFVVDTDGKKYNVEALVGANDIYDVCKFKVEGQTPSASVSQTPVAEKEQLWLVGYKAKSPRLLHSSVKKVEPFSTTTAISSEKSYGYYILDLQTPENVLFSPLLNENGEVVALLHTASKDGVANAVSAVYPSEMNAQTIGAGAITLSASSIPVVLPSDYKDAQLTLLMASQNRKGEAYNTLVDYFIKKFPQKVDGYEARARIFLSNREYDKAEQDMQKAISISEDKADQHYALSQLILDKNLYMPQDSVPSWSLERALSETESAYSQKDSPLFLHQKAKVLAAMRRFEDAAKVYLSLQNTSLAGPDMMVAASMCRQQAGAPFEETIALMDSALNCCPQPLTFQSAKYVSIRANMYQQEGLYRKAINDFNLYEKLMVGYNLHPDFYYNRFICERESKQFQQALDDISKAIEKNSNNEGYRCEKASLLLRLRMNEEAIAEANRALIINPESADAYAVLGAAQCSLGKKHEGLLNLQQAKSLGYSSADELINRFSK